MTRATRIAQQLHKSLGEKSFHVRYVDAQGKETRRTITPFALFQQRERFGVYAYCHAREQMRSFYCARISNLDPVPALKVFTHKEMIELMINSPRWLNMVCDQEP